MKKLIFHISIAILTCVVGISAALIRASLTRSETTQEPSLPTSEVTQQVGSDEAIPEEEGWTFEQGIYSNYEYAYSVRIPDGLVGYRSPAPMPNHGFGIDLSKEDEAAVWLDGSYNALEWSSLAEATRAQLDFLKDDKDISDVRIVKRTSTRLSGLPAVHVVIDYRKAGIPRVEETIFVLRNSRDIVYTLELRTTPARFSEDRKVLEQLQQTFRREPLPDP